MSEQQYPDLRKMNGFVVRAVKYTASILEELDKETKLKDADKIEFAEPLQSLLKKDVGAKKTELESFGKDLDEYAKSMSREAEVPAIIASRQQLVNTCLDCYITNLKRARELLDKRFGASLNMSSLDEELKLVDAVRAKYYKK